MHTQEKSITSRSCYEFCYLLDYNISSQGRLFVVVENKGRRVSQFHLFDHVNHQLSVGSITSLTRGASVKG